MASSWVRSTPVNWWSGVRKALGDVLGDAAVIQRCQLHKGRNLDATRAESAAGLRPGRPAPGVSGGQRDHGPPAADRPRDVAGAVDSSPKGERVDNDPASRKSLDGL